MWNWNREDSRLHILQRKALKRQSACMCRRLAAAVYWLQLSHLEAGTLARILRISSLVFFLDHHLFLKNTVQSLHNKALASRSHVHNSELTLIPFICTTSGSKLPNVCNKHITQMTVCAHVTDNSHLTLRARKPEESSHPGTMINRSDGMQQSWDRPACLGWLLLYETDFILPAEALPLN